MNMINRNSAEALIPEQVSKTIIQNVATRLWRCVAATVCRT